MKQRSQRLSSQMMVNELRQLLAQGCQKSSACFLRKMYCLNSIIKHKQTTKTHVKLAKITNKQDEQNFRSNIIKQFLSWMGWTE